MHSRCQGNRQLLMWGSRASRNGLAFVSDGNGGKQRQKAIFFYSPDDNVSFHDVYDVLLEMNDEGAASSSIHLAYSSVVGTAGRLRLLEHQYLSQSHRYSTSRTDVELRCNGFEVPNTDVMSESNPPGAYT